MRKRDAKHKSGMFERRSERMTQRKFMNRTRISAPKEHESNDTGCYIYGHWGVLTKLNRKHPHHHERDFPILPNRNA